jgi:hypothetical protein
LTASDFSAVQNTALFLPFYRAIRAQTIDKPQKLCYTFYKKKRLAACFLN